MAKEINAYIIARNTKDESGRVEYWSDERGWTLDKAIARTYRTLQGADKTKATREDDSMLYVTH